MVKDYFSQCNRYRRKPLYLDFIIHYGMTDNVASDRDFKLLKKNDFVVLKHEQLHGIKGT